MYVAEANRSEIFCADADYQFYLEKLQLACQIYKEKVDAYNVEKRHPSVQPHPVDVATLTSTDWKQIVAALDTTLEYIELRNK